MRFSFLRSPLFNFLIPIVCAVLVLFNSSQASAQNLSVTGVSPYSALDVTTNFDAAIASITESWAGLSGVSTYTLSVRSSNGGLAHATQAGPKIPYSITYFGSGGASVTMMTADQVIGTRTVPGSLFGGNDSANAKITFTGRSSSSLFQGTYSDILTFTYRRDNGTTITKSLTLTAATNGSSLSLSISPNASANNLPLDTTQANLVVATATEYSNSTTGYVVKVQSANGGFLKLSTAANPTPTQKITYSIKYAGTAATLTTPNTNTIVKTQTAGVYEGTASAISISYSAPTPGSVLAGTYTDTLTFTIEAQ